MAQEKFCLLDSCEDINNGNVLPGPATKAVDSLDGHEDVNNASVLPGPVSTVAAEHGNSFWENWGTAIETGAVLIGLTLVFLIVQKMKLPSLHDKG